MHARPVNNPDFQREYRMTWCAGIYAAIPQTRGHPHQHNLELRSLCVIITICADIVCIILPFSVCLSVARAGVCAKASGSTPSVSLFHVLGLRDVGLDPSRP